MECFKNITKNNTNSLARIMRNRNHTNSTNSTAANFVNTTRKILFCKSKALFFKKVYKALKNEKEGSGASQVAIVQTTGKNLEDFMDKDCFVDSDIDDDQVYNIEFTVAIM